MSTLRPTLLILVLALAGCAVDPARIVLVAGDPSHYPGAHEHNAGIMLLARCLQQNEGIEPVVVKGGWPEDESVFDGARAIVFYMDGVPRNALLVDGRLESLDRLMAKGVGLGLIHFGLEVPRERGGPEFLRWIGGYYERPYSKNPFNDVELQQASPEHPISRGWESFQAKDEWYYQLRFATGGGRIIPLLTSMLPADNPKPQTLAWAFERESGGRGFGFTGGHVHTNWGIPEYRQIVLNSILWIAGVEVPPEGARSELTAQDLEENLDPGKPSLDELLGRE